MSYMLLLILSKTGILENINNVFQLRFHRPICMMYHEAQDRKALQIRLTREGARNVYLHQLCIPVMGNIRGRLARRTPLERGIYHGDNWHR